MLCLPLFVCVVALVAKTFAIKETCDTGHETPCAIINVQNVVYRAVAAIQAASNATELSKVYADITNTSFPAYNPPGGFTPLVIDEYAVCQTGGLTGMSFQDLIMGAHIITTPNLSLLFWYAAQPGGGTFLQYLWSGDSTKPAQQSSAYILPARLYNGRTVAVASFYTVLEPGAAQASLCSAKEFKTCSSFSAPALAVFTLMYVYLDTSAANFHSVLNQITNREHFLIYGGFYPFVVNISDAGTIVASGLHPDLLGKKWSQIATHFGAKTLDNLDEFLIEKALIGEVTWLSFPWLASNNEADCDKKVFIVPFENNGNFYYLGVAINDPNPYIEFTDYQVPKTLMNLNIALTAIIGTTFLVISGLFLYEMKSVLIRMSSPLFLIASLLGGVLLSAVSILYMLFPTSNGDTTICQLRAWLLPAGLSIMISPILAKTYRVSVLIKAMKKVSGLSGMNLSIAILLLAIPAIIIVAANPKSTISTSVFTSVSEYTYLSQCEDVSSMYGLLIAYYALLVAYCFYLAYQIKDAPDGFNEATYIYVACSFLFVYGILVIPIQFLLESSPIALSVLRSFGILIGSLVFVGCITFPKVYHIIKGDHNNKELQQKRTYKTGNGNSASAFVHPASLEHGTKDAASGVVSVDATGGGGGGGGIA